MKYFTSLLGISMETEDRRGLEIYQGLMCFAYISSKYVGTYKQVQSLCQSVNTRFKLRGKPADTLRECQTHMQDIENNQKKWFDQTKVKNKMRNLNTEFNKDYFTADELVKTLIEIEFITLDEACKHGRNDYPF